MIQAEIYEFYPHKKSKRPVKEHVKWPRELVQHKFRAWPLSKLWVRAFWMTDIQNYSLPLCPVVRQPTLTTNFFMRKKKMTTKLSNCVGLY